jgi:hypothetical protein
VPVPGEEGSRVVNEGGLVVVQDSVVIPSRQARVHVLVPRGRLHETGDGLLERLSVLQGHLPPGGN